MITADAFTFPNRGPLQERLWVENDTGSKIIKQKCQHMAGHQSEKQTR
jgi:hypothetical protein